MPRVPDGRTLQSWIRELEAAGRMYRFYKTKEWLDLRARVLADNHNECERCRARGVYSRAATVHHVNEVLARPDLALSRYYRDADGWHANLVALCARCHNIEHGRFFGAPRRVELNEERW